MEENYKIGFFKKLKLAICNLEDYDIFAVEKIGKAFAYFIKLMLLFSAIISIGIAYQFIQNFYNTIDEIEANMPDFTYENGKLKADETSEITSEVVGTILMDTNDDVTEKSENIKKLKTYTSGVLLLDDKIIVKLPETSNIVEYDYNTLSKQYGLEKFTKTELIEYVRSLNKVSLGVSFYLACIMYMFVIYAILTLLDVVLLSILGLLTARIARIRIKYKAVVNIAVYALTLPILLNAMYILVNSFTGFEIKYFQIMYNAIGYIYVVTAILMIKSEMIKQEMELIKLAEEQKRVKEELEHEKEEERQKEEQKKREKDKDKKEKEGKEEKKKGTSRRST